MGHSDRFFTGMTVVAMIGHAGILTAALVVGVRSLAVFNVASCLVYGIAYVTARRGRLAATFLIGLVEVTAHSWFATAVLGFGSGFHIYALSLIPLAMSFDLWPMKRRIGLCGLLVASYVCLAVTGSMVFVTADSPYIDLFRYGNLTVGALVLAALSYYYVTAVNRVEQLLVEQNRILDSLSRTDQLTQLPNRRQAVEWLAHEAARARRSGSRACVCLADVDKFKTINDTYGHEVGDEALVYLARVIGSSLRDQDVTARWGGEEFLILLPDTGLDGGVVAMEKVRRALADRPFENEQARVEVSITIGVAELTSEGSVDDVVRGADRALYRGKAEGRNRVVRG